jgi:hypothetical protein
MFFNVLNYSIKEAPAPELEHLPLFIRQPPISAVYRVEINYFDHPATKRVGVKLQTSETIADPNKAWEAATMMTDAIVGLCPGAQVWEMDDEEIIDPNRFEIPILDSQDRPVAIVSLIVCEQIRIAAAGMAGGLNASFGRHARD